MRFIHSHLSLAILSAPIAHSLFHSGDLKDPAASIPPGTLAAVFATTLVFSGQVLMCGSSVLRDTLLTDKVIVSRLAYPVSRAA
jgi:hypothetical protein